MRKLTFALFVAATTFTSAAYAHSHFESSEPKAGAVLAAAPDSVKITFEEALRPKESTIAVLNSKKTEVNTEAATVSEDGKTLSETLPTLTSGTYTVKWKAVCMCTDHHATSGSYKFSVK